jgi:hypothetical protein
MDVGPTPREHLEKAAATHAFNLPAYDLSLVFQAHLRANRPGVRLVAGTCGLLAATRGSPCAMAGLGSQAQGRR